MSDYWSEHIHLFCHKTTPCFVNTTADPSPSAGESGARTDSSTPRALICDCFYFTTLLSVI